MPRTTNPGDESERIRRITNTPTLILADVANGEQPGDPATPAHPAKQAKKPRATKQETHARRKYLPAQHLWHKTIDRLITGSAISTAQAESWLGPCQLSILDLPSGEVVSAHVQTQTSFAAEHIRHHYARVIRFTLQVLTNKQVILFVRGPNYSPDEDPPDGYDVA